jgi:hypothetical protein
MTEAEWAACGDPDKMLAHLLGRRAGPGLRLFALLGFRRNQGPEGECRASDRKLRLYTVACCLRIRSLLPDQRSRNALEVSARYADERASEEDLRAAQAAARSATVASNPAFSDESVSVAGGLFVAAGKSQLLAADAAAAAASLDINEVIQSVSRVEQAAVEASAEPHRAELWAEAIGAAVRAGFIREIFGNPFHPSSPLREGVLAWNDATVLRLAEGIYQEKAFERLPILADALVDAGCEQEEVIGHCREERPHMRGCWGVDLILGRS